ncbi:hypothetical protein D5086_012458 [Populus alba]|uniref:Uncharacterized protein n=1 Tax=Populus alba TaxID=43335 RepID=A0ACC4C318_POPAL
MFSDIQEASSAGVREFLEEFLSNWSLVDGQHYVLVGAEVDVDVQDGCDRRCILEVDKYMEVLLRRLHSLYSLKTINSSQVSAVVPENNHEAHYSLSKELNGFEGSPKGLEANYLRTGENNTKQTILKLSRRVDPCLWWFRSVNFESLGMFECVYSLDFSFQIYLFVDDDTNPLRRATAPPAPPDGLCLVDVGYTEFDPQNCVIP